MTKMFFQKLQNKLQCQHRKGDVTQGLIAQATKYLQGIPLYNKSFCIDNLVHGLECFLGSHYG